MCNQNVKLQELYSCLKSFVTKEVDLIEALKVPQAICLVPTTREDLYKPEQQLGKCSLISKFMFHNPQIHEELLTSKLICPPIENVRLKAANFSRSTDTISARILCICGKAGLTDENQQKGKLHVWRLALGTDVPCHTFQTHPFPPGYNFSQ